MVKDDLSVAREIKKLKEADKRRKEAEDHDTIDYRALLVKYVKHAALLGKLPPLPTTTAEAYDLGEVIQWTEAELAELKLISEQVLEDDGAWYDAGGDDEC